MEVVKFREQVTIPIVAIGGINHENVKEVIANGADGIVVVSAISKHSSIKNAAQKLINHFEC